MLKIRFAPIAAAVKVKNLTPFVSNELLEYAFSIFGEVCGLDIFIIYATNNTNYFLLD